ncbi:hypothetical protein [Streptomyces sp. NPDC051636]|uniref:hypothetical protein n=1 Tax=Streptomyces sp. NPDC051636 TaxID=3365663 RepID=UPI0037A34B21
MITTKAVSVSLLPDAVDDVEQVRVLYFVTALRTTVISGENTVLAGQALARS